MKLSNHLSLALQPGGTMILERAAEEAALTAAFERDAGLFRLQLGLSASGKPRTCGCTSLSRADRCEGKLDSAAVLLAGNFPKELEHFFCRKVWTVPASAPNRILLLLPDSALL